jgi:hypothetical protein
VAGNRICAATCNMEVARGQWLASNLLEAQ